MKCPYCRRAMQPGGIITDGVVAMWHPQAEFDKTGLDRMLYTGGRSIGKSSILWNQTKIPGAWYCPDCKKVVGIFDADT